VVVTDHSEPKLEIRRLRATHRQPLELLRGTVLRLDQPTEPVAEQDWDATK
jgi:hypothetical protein